jgi:hypothetical protein
MYVYCVFLRLQYCNAVDIIVVWFVVASMSHVIFLIMWYVNYWNTQKIHEFYLLLLIKIFYYNVFKVKFS